MKRINFMYWYGFLTGYINFLSDSDPYKESFIKLANELLEYGKTQEKIEEEE